MFAKSFWARLVFGVVHTGVKNLMLLSELSMLLLCCTALADSVRQTYQMLYHCGRSVLKQKHWQVVALAIWTDTNEIVVISILLPARQAANYLLACLLTFQENQTPLTLIPLLKFPQSKLSALSKSRIACAYALPTEGSGTLICNAGCYCSTGMVTSIISDMSTTPESLLSVSSTRCLNHWSSTGSEPYHNLPFLSPVPSLEPTGEWYTSSSVICRAPGSECLHQHTLHRDLCTLKRIIPWTHLTTGIIYGYTQSLLLPALKWRMSI